MLTVAQSHVLTCPGFPWTILTPRLSFALPVSRPLFPLQVTKSRLSVTANYPDPILTNPNGWRVGTKANATQVIVSTTNEGVDVVTQAAANSKLAPAIATATTNTLTQVPTRAVTTADAFGRPGLQYGVTLTAADSHMQNLSEYIFVFVFFCWFGFFCLHAFISWTWRLQLTYHAPELLHIQCRGHSAASPVPFEASTCSMRLWHRHNLQAVTVFVQPSAQLCTPLCTI